MSDTYFVNDFGCNFASLSRYPDEKLKHIMAQAWDHGVDKIVCISNSTKEALRCIELADKYENMHFTVGTHPHNANNFKPDDLKMYEEALKNPKCFGIGECGLDYNRNYSSKENQIIAFRAQIELAKRTNSKLYLHCRDAFDDFIRIVDEYKYYNGLIHCFTGNIDQAIEFTKRGFLLGITGWLLDKRRNQDLYNAIKDPRIQINMLVSETDAPFMAMNRKKESVPEDVYLIIEMIARIKSMDSVTVGKIIYANSLKFLANSCNLIKKAMIAE